MRAVSASLLLILAVQSPVLAKPKREKQLKCFTLNHLCVANECAILSTADAKDLCIDRCSTALDKCMKKANRAATGDEPGMGASRQPTLSQD